MLKYRRRLFRDWVIRYASYDHAAEKAVHAIVERDPEAAKTELTTLSRDQDSECRLGATRSLSSLAHLTWYDEETPRDVELVWENLLQDSIEKVRLEAALQLAHCHRSDSTVLHNICSQLTESLSVSSRGDAFGIVAALRSLPLTNLRSQPLADALNEFLDISCLETRGMVISSLGDCGSFARRSVSDLIEQTRHKTPLIRFESLVALSAIVSSGRAVHAAFLRLEDKNQAVQAAACFALLRMGKKKRMAGERLDFLRVRGNLRCREYIEVLDHRSVKD